MSRRRKSILRKVNPDPKYGSIELSKFINRLMKGGKKSVARKAVYLAIDKLENQTKRPGLELFEEAKVLKRNLNLFSNNFDKYFFII